MKKYAVIYLFLILNFFLCSCAKEENKFVPKYRKDVGYYEVVKNLYVNYPEPDIRINDDELLWLNGWEQSPVLNGGYSEISADKNILFCFLGGYGGVHIRMAVINTASGAVRHQYFLECREKAAPEKLLKLDARENFFVLFNVYPKDWGQGLPYWFLYDLRHKKLVFMAPSKLKQPEEDGTDELFLGLTDNEKTGIKNIIITSSLGDAVAMYEWDKLKYEYRKVDDEAINAAEE